MARIDANVILRYFTSEPADQAERSKRLFERIEAGELSATVDDITVAEVVWTLSSFYQLPRTKIVELVLEILTQEGISCRDGDAILSALALYRDRGISFIDALLSARMLDSPDNVIYSFDHHFDRIQGIVRREPE